ncbi:MAG: tetratricopeptide repeat protein [Pseudomonadota bacterium]
MGQTRIARFLTGAAVIAALAACEPTADETFAPGVDQSENGIDGLIVGHRLMAAGEYELALEAYYRAGNEQGLTVDVMSAIGSANLRLGRLGQAEAALREAIRIDETFVPAWNNLGVTLYEQSKFAEAERIFETAFKLDSGASAAIRDNLALAGEKVKNPGYTPEKDINFGLIRRGAGDYVLLPTP